MKSLFFPCALLLPLAATSSLHAQEPPSARLEVQHGSNLILRGDWLYWQANETGLSFALQQEGFEPENPEPMGFGHVVNPDFSWHSGFRLGLGFNIPHDQWDANLLWTNYEGKALGHAKTNSDELLYPSFIHPNSYNDQQIFACHEAKGDLSIHLNVLELNLARSFKGGRFFSLKPSFGIKTAWVYQRYELEYKDLYHYQYNEYSLSDRELTPVLENYYTHVNNNFWGIGPQVGVDIDMALRFGISLFGNVNLSLLYGLFDLSYAEDFTGAEGLEGMSIRDSNSFHAGRALTDLQLGLRWNRSYRNDRIRLLFQGGWEQHMFFSQNQIMRFVDGENWGIFTQNQGDLFFQGFSLSTTLFF